MARENPGIHSVQVGEITVTAMNDGQFDASVGMLVNADAAECEALLRDTFRVSPPRISVSCFLLEWPDRRAVVDFGAGGAFGGLLGRAAARLRALGVAPEAIGDVLLTHGHIDHLGGLVSGGAAVFPNAELHGGAAELAYWSDPGNTAGRAETARAAIAAYPSRPFEGGAEVIPGVVGVPLPGHTPGHTGYLITSGADSLLIWADIVHMPGIQFARPEIGINFDSDPEAARASRLRALDMAAADRLLVAGIHHDFPLFGHVAPRGAGYAFEAMVWAPTATGLLA